MTRTKGWRDIGATVDLSGLRSKNMGSHVRDRYSKILYGDPCR
jgi:hypothetical protein